MSTMTRSDLLAKPEVKRAVTEIGVDMSRRGTVSSSHERPVLKAPVP